MTGDSVVSASVSKAPSRLSEWRRVLTVFTKRRIVVFGMVVILVFLIFAIFAPFIAPYPPNDTDLNNTLSQPTRTHLLGTDALGRDTLSRIIYGARTSLVIGLVAVGISCIVGMGLGLLAGYYGSWTNTIVMRFIDALMSFPMILLALAIAALLGSGMRNVIIALSVALVSGYARLMHGQVLSVKENDYMLAARSIGAGNFRIMMRHVVPNCLSPIIVLFSMMLGGAILAEAGLSFLGIGITPPTATWGNMVNDGRQYLLSNPILSFAPGAALMLVVFAFNMVGDGLRDALDPRLRGTI